MGLFQSIALTLISRRLECPEYTGSQPFEHLDWRTATGRLRSSD